MATKTSQPENPDRCYRGIGIVQRKIERRARLINAAIKCFGRDGYHATTLKSLCSEAGLTERYFYESFASFDEILCCSYQHAADAIFDIVIAAMATAEPAPLPRMRTALTSYFKAIAADPARARLVLIEIEGASENANQVYRAQLRSTSDLIRLTIFRELPDNPDNGLSLKLLATAVLGAVYQLAKEWTLSGFKLPRAALVRNLEAVVAGILGEWQVRQTPVAGKRVKKKQDTK